MRRRYPARREPLQAEPPPLPEHPEHRPQQRGQDAGTELQLIAEQRAAASRRRHRHRVLEPRHRGQRTGCRAPGRAPCARHPDAEAGSAAGTRS